MVAEYVNRGCGRCNLPSSHFFGAGPLTRPVGKDCPSHCRSESADPIDVLLRGEVITRADLSLSQRETATIDRHMSQLARQAWRTLELQIAPPPTRKRQQKWQVRKIWLQRGLVERRVERDVYASGRGLGSVDVGSRSSRCRPPVTPGKRSMSWPDPSGHVTVNTVAMLSRSSMIR